MTKKHAPQIYLASASPRRQELLQQIDICFEQLVPDVDEKIRTDESINETVIRLACEKASAGWQHSGRALEIPVLGADTMVINDGVPLGKPEDRQQGCDMLMSLSGKVHQVLSAVCIVKGDQAQSLLSVSQVEFRKFAEAEAQAYWETGEPHDKAGAYGIQGKGAIFVKALQGSYSGVMGLPLYETAQLLEQFGIAVLKQ